MGIKMIKLDWNILFNIINIFIFYLLMKKFLFKPVTDIMERRTNGIRASITEAENRREEAIRLKQQYEDALADAGRKAEEIIKAARQKASEERDRQIRATMEEIEALKDTANKSIELERKKSVEEVKAEIAELAIIAATKIIKKNLDEDVNKRFLNEFIHEAGNVR